MVSKYGNTWLTEIIRFSQDEEKVDRDWRVWRIAEDTIGFSYSLSRLGVINGLLRRVGLILFCEVADDSLEIQRWRIRKDH